MRRILEAISLAIMIAVSVWIVPQQAFASGLQWTTLQQGAASLPGVPTSFVTRLQNLAGKRVYVNNNLGAAILRIPAADAVNMHFTRALSSPIVFAKYDPQNTAGMISVMRMLRMPNGDVVITQAQVTPSSGSLFAADFEGTNPWWQFKGGLNGAFVHITAAAFWTAVGLVMQHTHASVGWIAVTQTHSNTSTSCSGNWRKHCTTTETVKMYPEWVLAVPSGVAVGQSQGYVLPLCSIIGQGPAGAGAYCDSNTGRFLTPQQSTTLATSMTIGDVGTPSAPVTATIGGQTVGAMKVLAGVSFVSQGPGNNLNHSQFVSFTHSESKSGWTGLAMIAFSVIVGALTFGAGFALMAAASPMLAASISAIGISSITGAAAAGAAVVGGASLGYNYVKSGALGGGTGQTQAQQTHLIGGSGQSWDAPIGNYGVQTQLSSLYGNTATSGYTNVRPNPMSQSNGWDPRAANYQQLTKPTGQTPGGFSGSYQSNSLQMASAQLPSGLAQLARSGVQLNTSGDIQFGISPYGNLSSINLGQ